MNCVQFIKYRNKRNSLPLFLLLDQFISKLISEVYIIKLKSVVRIYKEAAILNFFISCSIDIEINI